MELVVNFAVITCCHQGCGVVFAVPAWWENNRRADHTLWFCPNGHSQHFSAESDEEKERRLRKEAEQRILNAQAKVNEARHEAEVLKRQVAVQKGLTTRLKNRVHCGVCTCCNRTFTNVAEHMKTKHPEALDPGHERKLLTA